MLFEPWIYNDNDNSFERHFSDKIFCDSEGQLFQVKEKQGTDSWRRWLRFLPNFYRVDLKFESLGRQMELSDLQSFLCEKLKEHEWVETVKLATSFEELLKGEK
jgi:hypothetical protein